MAKNPKEANKKSAQQAQQAQQKKSDSFQNQNDSMQNCR